jgi:hypothetical protein
MAVAIHRTPKIRPVRSIQLGSGRPMRVTANIHQAVRMAQAIGTVEGAICKKK